MRSKPSLPNEPILSPPYPSASQPPVLQPPVLLSPALQPPALQPSASQPPPFPPHPSSGFDVDAWFATSEMIAEPQKMMLELVVSWQGGILDICHYRTPRRITFGNDPRADFCYSLDDLPLPSQHSLFPLIEPGGEGFMLGFHTEMRGTVEHNGESFTLRELVKAGRAHYFARSGCCYYPLSPGVRVHLDLDGLDLSVQFVPIPPLQFHRLRQMGLQAPVLSFSVIAHLLFVLFAVSSGSSTAQEAAQTSKETVASPLSKPRPSLKTLGSQAFYFEPIHLGPIEPSILPLCPPALSHNDPLAEKPQKPARTAPLTKRSLSPQKILCRPRHKAPSLLSP
ncbi:hypothetical protein L6R29_13045 [Myxococcota bacterium]|nr:hypothetical protein [Myxococcota bacterium]